MAAYPLSDIFWQQVDTFTTLLLQYNQTHNISGAKSKEVVLKNVEDSIYPLEYLHVNEIKSAIDIGTGAGFPGLLLALALPHVHFTLFEPIAKKSAFLHLLRSILSVLVGLPILKCWSSCANILLILPQHFFFTKANWWKRRSKDSQIVRFINVINAIILL